MEFAEFHWGYSSFLKEDRIEGPTFKINLKYLSKIDFFDEDWSAESGSGCFNTLFCRNMN